MTSFQEKKDKFRKYLDKCGVINSFTEVLVRLYEEPNRPDDALEYVRGHLCKRNIDTVENLKADLISANETIAKLQREVAACKAKLPLEVSEAFIKILEDGLNRLNDEDSNSLVRKYLPNVREKLESVPSRYGTSLAECLQASFEYPHDPHLAIYVGDADYYNVFADFLDPIIREYHNLTSELEEESESLQPETDWNDPDKFKNIDPDGKYIKWTRMSVSKNLKDFPFVPKMTENDFIVVCEKLKETLLCLEDEYEGTFQPLESIDYETNTELQKDNVSFDRNNKLFESAGGYRFWPSGRAIYYNAPRTFAVWINHEDHLQIISMSQTANFPEVYRRLVDIMPSFDSLLEYDRGLYGFTTTSPSNLGTTIRASVQIELPKSLANPEEFKKRCEELNLEIFLPEQQVVERVEIANKTKLGITEWDAVQRLHDGLQKLMSEEAKIPDSSQSESDKAESDKEATKKDESDKN